MKSSNQGTLNWDENQAIIFNETDRDIGSGT